MAFGQYSLRNHIDRITSAENLLFVQDLDGVCIPLVSDPLTRKMDKSYIKDVNKFNGDFYVLTNGEHEGRRGVNRLIEDAFCDDDFAKSNGYYLPGLAAGGIQYQDKYGSISYLRARSF